MIVEGTSSAYLFRLVVRKRDFVPQKQLRWPIYEWNGEQVKNRFEKILDYATEEFVKSKLCWSGTLSPLVSPISSVLLRRLVDF